MRFDVMTLFPEMFSGYLGQSLLKLAIQNKLVEVHVHNIRDWAKGKHKTVDDRPFGGGPGMVLKVEPVVECVEAVAALDPRPGKLILLTPQGRKLDQTVVEELAQPPSGTQQPGESKQTSGASANRLMLLCGRYEGFDERIIQILRPMELSIGDFVLNGGEVAAMVVIDTVVRLVPGVLGDEHSHRQDSFSGESRLLEFSQYTRPREFRGLTVPEILLSGDHEQIAQWRHEQSLERTRDRRSDLLKPNEGSPKRPRKQSE